jgi:hypothetical protein
MIKKREVHGLISLFLIVVAIMIGVISIFTASLPMAAAYLVIIFLSTIVIIYSFCSKCACRSEGCGHVLPGKIAGLLPPREEGTYTFPDIGGLVISIILLFGFPQYWLWGNMILMVIFWVFIIIGLTEIRIYVCPRCSNENCPICTKAEG